MAAEQLWVIYVEGETLGPFTTELVGRMLQQNRLRFVDFGWSEGMVQWARISDLKPFSGLLPSYPKVAPPGSGPKASESPVPTPPPAPIARQISSKIRQIDRIAIEGSILIVDHGTFDITNVSEGGVFVRSTVSGRIPVGTELKFTLKSEFLAKPQEMTGVVIRQSHAGESIQGFAVEFTRVNPAHKRILQEFVRTRLAQRKK